MESKYKIENIVAETLLIPLYMRAKESRKGKDAILKDELAEKLVNSIDYDYTQLDNAKMSELGCLVRGWYFDNAIRHFIITHPRPIVVNVGCGLDTRAQRIGYDSNALFYELDLPEVIELRRKFIPETNRDRYIAGSLLETDWMDKIKKDNPNGNFIFVVEGVLMYFYREQVQEFVHRIADRFSKGELWFDVCGTLMASKHGVRPDSLRKNKVEIRSGFSNAHVIESWDSRMILKEQVPYMRFFRKRWGFFIGQILGRMPKVCYLFSSLMGFSIE